MSDSNNDDMDIKPNKNMPDYFAENSRNVKSLGLLTQKFVYLLQTSKDGILDLKVVCK